MSKFTRRQVIQTGTALGALAAFGSPFMAPRNARAQMMFKPEDGAELTLLRWKRFVQSEEDAFLKLVADFTAKTGVTVNVQSESLDDVQPKASVAANVNQGPDLVWGLYSLPHLFPDKLLDLTDLADSLGKANGGWVEAAVTYGKSGDKWIAIPACFNGNYINYRISAVEKAGFSNGVPQDLDGFLELMRAMKANGQAGGFALGHASGDGNAWVHWALWAHGGALVDENDKIIINSPETAAACEYVKKLADASVEGIAAWNDGTNNKAFLGSEVWLTNNGISIYAAAQREGMTEIAEDMDHALWPTGPVGFPTEFHIAYPMMAFQYTKYPNACKAFIEYMMSPEAHGPWLTGAVGYLTQSLNAYESLPVWTDDPKRTVFRDAAKRTLTAGYKGSVGDKAAAALAEFIVLDMFAEYATGASSLEDAMGQAERKAQRIYR
ncbi:ABC transporter substrate-binding protein [Limibacillus halophilus]|jgi:multiple sugar transport system substrate-binding protein